MRWCEYVAWCMGALLLATLTHPHGVHAQAPPPAKDACGALLDEFYDKLRKADPPGSKDLCADDTCQGVSEIDNASTAIKRRLDALTTGRDADKNALRDHLKAIDDKVGLLRKGLADLGVAEASEALRQLQYAKRVCERTSAAIAARIGVMTAGLVEEAKVAVCTDKMRRLPAFLADYYGLSSGTPAVLKIVRARYGDIYNEDRDYRRMQPNVVLHNPRRRDATVPRAEHDFRDPEYYQETSTDRDRWDRHRHTCDITWYFRKMCEARVGVGGATVVANDQDCLIENATANKGLNLCGYNPAPKGDHRLHVWYTCGGVHKHLKLPSDTTKIRLTCSSPEQRDLEAELAYFKAEPCAVTLPGSPSRGPDGSPSPGPPSPGPGGQGQKPG